MCRGGVGHSDQHLENASAIGNYVNVHIDATLLEATQHTPHLTTCSIRGRIQWGTQFARGIHDSSDPDTTRRRAAIQVGQARAAGSYHDYSVDYFRPKVSAGPIELADKLLDTDQLTVSQIHSRARETGAPIALVQFKDGRNSRSSQVHRKALSIKARSLQQADRSLPLTARTGVNLSSDSR